MQAPPAISVKPGSLVLCADGGYLYAKRLGIEPDCVLGDFDTLDEALAPCKRIRHPVRKDDTDTMLAVKYGLSEGCRDFVLYGTIGGRLDHTLANIQTLCYLHEQGASGVLIGEHDRALLHLPGTKTYPAHPGMYFSVLAMQTPCTGVTLRGVQFPLDRATLTTAFPLGVSNEILGEQAEVTLESGLLLLVFSKDTHQIPQNA